MLERAKESRAQDPNGISAWLVAEHADWLDVKKENISDDVEMVGDEEEIKAPRTNEKTEDMKATLDKFEKSHKDILTVFKPEMNSMIVCTLRSLQNRRRDPLECGKCRGDALTSPGASGFARQYPVHYRL